MSEKDTLDIFREFAKTVKREEFINGASFCPEDYGIDFKGKCWSGIDECRECMRKAVDSANIRFLWEGEKMSNTKTFQEVIKDIKEGEVWSNDIKEIRLSPVNQLIIKSKINLKDSEMYFDFEGKYTLKRKKVSFTEAFAAYEQGKEIESCWSDEKYKKTVYYADKVLDCFWNGDRYVINEDGFDLDEIRGFWYINE